MSRRWRSRLVPYVLIALVVSCYIFPLLFLVNTALKSNVEFLRNPLGLVQDIQLGNFVQAWEQGNFAAYTLNSVFYTLTAATLGTFISLVMGFPVARGYLKGGRVWSGLFVAILFLPNALIMQFQFLLRINLYDTAIGYILLMAAGVGIGPLLVSGFVRSIPFELDEAAALDGIGYWRYLWTFVVPLAKPALATVFVLQAIGVWNEIILATVILADPTKFPISVGLLAFQGTYTSQWSLLAAATLIVATPLIVAYIFIQRYLVGGLAGGAVKG